MPRVLPNLERLAHSGFRLRRNLCLFRFGVGRHVINPFVALFVLLRQHHEERRAIVPIAALLKPICPHEIQPRHELRSAFLRKQELSVHIGSAESKGLHLVPQHCRLHRCSKLAPFFVVFPADIHRKGAEFLCRGQRAGFFHLCHAIDRSLRPGKRRAVLLIGKMQLQFTVQVHMPRRQRPGQ